MFTGLVEAIGSVASFESAAADRRLCIDCGALGPEDLKPGDSIAVNGVCLSVVALRDGGFAADVSVETLSCTTLGRLTTGGRVNLEQALLPTTRLGGHLVSGHVDAIAEIVRIEDAGQSRRLTISAPERLARYIAPKGSVCIDGVSLTVNEVKPAAFTVNIIPHTLEHTIIGGYRESDGVNIEVDLVARYLERLLVPSPESDARRKSPVDYAFLKEHGFVNDV